MVVIREHGATINDGQGVFAGQGYLLDTTVNTVSHKKRKAGIAETVI
jgi:hypothetical protein